MILSRQEMSLRDPVSGLRLTRQKDCICLKSHACPPAPTMKSFPNVYEVLCELTQPFDSIAETAIVSQVSGSERPRFHHEI